ncbi:MAG: type I polyketide synthase [Gallionellaceae bacterium]
MSQSAPDYRSLITKSLLEIKELKAQLRLHEESRTEPIAIVGMACRFPGGSNSPERYWDLLRDGVDAIQEVPTERWDLDRFYDADHSVAGKMYTRYGGFIDDIGGFDAGFFGISPLEAESLDPHQRVLLEVCWEAIEQANLLPEALSGSNTGVFVGASSMDQIINRIGEAPLTEIGPYHGSGCAMAPIAGRVSYVFGFNGPSFVMDTACSSSLLSLHLAAESLRRRECNLALAGGVHLLFHPGYSVAFSKAGMLSVDGRCKTFDASANGYARGEGCGVVVLKRLSDAKRDGDNILALLRGSAINQDGASGGLTVPNGPAQEQVIRQALAQGGIDASKVSYVEAHGTGTPLGDPIEIGALSNVFKQPLLVGSVKTNIGHLEASAGIAATIKVIMALQHQAIPAHLHLRNPNKLIPWSDISIDVPTSLTPWKKSNTGERIAGISAFGFSGSNVHLVLSDAPTVAVAEEVELPDAYQVLGLSARNEETLRALAERWVEGPLAMPVPDFAALCATAMTSRTAFKHRLSVVAKNAEEARSALRELTSQANHSETISAGGERPRVAFLFTGQGSQYLGMGKELYLSESVFRDAIDECEQLLHSELGLSLIELLYSEREDENTVGSDERSTLLNATANTQPALFAVEYALSRLWQSWGVEPEAVLGHSVGEYVAACIAGVFSLADGLRLISARARLMQALPAGGAMAAVLADSVQVEAAMTGRGEDLSIAAYNGPRNTVVSGPAAMLEPLLADFEARGVECRRLSVSHAFHSPLMAPMLEAFRQLASSITYSAPRLPVISNVTGRIAGAELASADYWVRHVLAPVRFTDGVLELAHQGYSFMIEIGPSATLVGMASQCLDAHDVTLLPSLRKNKEPRATMLAALGEYWVHGGEVNWSMLGGHTRRDLQLPTYPFQHRDYSQKIEVDAARDGLHGVTSLGLPLLARRFNSPLLSEILFETVFSRKTTPFIEDHRVFGQLVLAGASHLSMILSAVRSVETLGGGACSLTDVMFPTALLVPEKGERVVHLAITPQSQQSATFRLVGLSEEGQEPTLHAKGFISTVAVPEPVSDLQAIWQRCNEDVPVNAVYDLQRERKIIVGPSYHWLTALRRGKGETIAKLHVPSMLAQIIKRYSLHPGLIDSCFGAMVMAQTMDVEESFIPFSLQALNYYPQTDGSEIPESLLAHAVVRHYDDARMLGDIHLYSEQGELVAAFIGLEGRRASRTALLAAGNAVQSAPSLYRVGWEVIESASLLAAQVVPKRWLILGDATGLGEGLLTELRVKGMSVTLVSEDRKSTGLQKKGEDHYSLSARSAEGFRQLLDACNPFDGIVYLWGLAELAGDDMAAYQQSACAGALHLLQELAGQKIGVDESARQSRLRIMLVTQGSQAVLASDSLPAPQQALLWGLGQVAAEEYREWACVCVDLDANASTEQSLADLHSAIAVSDSENRIAWRAGAGYAARLETYSPVASDSEFFAQAELSYLITGARGAIGSELAAWLVQRGAKHLALISRSPVDKELLASLAELGAQASFYQADVADPVALAKVVKQIEEGQAPLGGVFHLAGLLDDGLITGQSWERWTRVLSPKVQGAWNLHQLTLAHKSPLFVSFSSVASLLGTAGQSSYAAANAFLDALAQHRRGAGLSGLSINWGPWGEVGMAARLDAEQQARLEALGMGRISTDSALGTMGRLLSSGSEGQVGVLAMEWQHYGQTHSSPFLTNVVLEDDATDEGVSSVFEQLQHVAASERKSLLIRVLIDVVTDVLHLSRDEVAPRERLFDLGVDSMIALDMKNRLQTLLGLPLSSTLLFDYPTIEALTDYFLEALSPVLVSKQLEPIAAEALFANTSVEDMSEAEAEAMLLAQLEQMEKRSE